MTQMVTDAKAVAINTHNTGAVSAWRESNRSVSKIQYVNTFLQYSFVTSLLVTYKFRF